jgi:DNA-binding CsgD family transcriptional regulator
MRLLIYLVFIFSVAFASAGVVIASRLRSRYKAGYFSALLYFQVFIFTFGFYGIWGQLVVRSFLEELVSPEILQRFSDISLFLGLPFIVFAWLMLVRFSAELAGRKKSRFLVPLFLLFNFFIVSGIGFLIAGASGIKPVLLIRYYFIGLNAVYTIAVALLILFPGNEKPALQIYEGRIAAFSMILLMVSQSVTLVFLDVSPFVGLLFIFLFFAGNSFLPLYLSYGTVLSALHEEPVRDLTFEGFCTKYEISPRESDIIREICNGLSNKEISDKLFIGLQTVKDHTHRIYIKTNVKSRVQLINLVKEAEG